MCRCLPGRLAACVHRDAVSLSGREPCGYTRARQRCGYDVLAGGQYSAQVGDGFLHAVWCRRGVHPAICPPAEDLGFIAGGTHAQRVEAGEFAASLPFFSSECTHTPVSSRLGRSVMVRIAYSPTPPVAHTATL